MYLNSHDTAGIKCVKIVKTLHDFFSFLPFHSHTVRSPIGKSLSQGKCPIFGNSYNADNKIEKNIKLKHHFVGHILFQQC